MVTLIHKDSGEVVATDKADFFGWFTFKGVPSGVYIVRAENVQRIFAVKNKNVRADIDLSSPVGAPDLTKAAIDWMNQQLGPEDIELNVSNQKGLHSFGYDQGRYVIDAGKGSQSEHLVQHFHRLCYEAIRT